MSQLAAFELENGKLFYWMDFDAVSIFAAPVPCFPTFLVGEPSPTAFLLQFLISFVICG